MVLTVLTVTITVLSSAYSLYKYSALIKKYKKLIDDFQSQEQIVRSYRSYLKDLEAQSIKNRENLVTTKRSRKSKKE